MTAAEVLCEAIRLSRSNSGGKRYLQPKLARVRELPGRHFLFAHRLPSDRLPCRLPRCVRSALDADVRHVQEKTQASLALVSGSSAQRSASRSIWPDSSRACSSDGLYIPARIESFNQNESGSKAKLWTSRMATEIDVYLSRSSCIARCPESLCFGEPMLFGWDHADCWT